MRYQTQLTTAAPVTVHLQFEADTLFVQNPTQYSVWVRIGSDQAPVSADDADWIVPPLNALTLPVTGGNFGLALGAPSLPSPMPGMPAGARIMLLDKSESVPALGSIAPSSISLVGSSQMQATPDQLLWTSPAGMVLGQSNFYTVQLPTNAHSVTLLVTSTAYFSALQVFGGTTGSLYFQLPAIPNVVWQPVTLPVTTSVDGTLSLNITPTSTLAKVWVIAHVDYGAVPITAYGAVPVSLSLRSAVPFNFFLETVVPANTTTWVKPFSLPVRMSQRLRLSSLYLHLAGSGTGLEAIVQFDSSLISIAAYTRFTHVWAGGDQLLTPQFDFLPQQDGYLSAYYANFGSTAQQINISFSGWLEPL